MPYYKFKKNDLFFNVLKTHPVNEFFIYNGKVYHNLKSQISGAFTASVPGVPPGNISLHELNVDRNKENHTFIPNTIENVDLGFIDEDESSHGTGISSMIFPFVEKNSDNHITLKHITDSEYNQNYAYGEMITGSYPLSASIKRNFYSSQESTANGFSQPEAAPPKGGNNQADPPSQITKGDADESAYTRRPRIQALRNTLNHYSYMSDQYVFSSSAPDTWRKDTQELNLISIPSIYYGQSIKRGTVDLKFYVKGKLVGRARDLKRNGELLDVSQEPFTKKSIFFSGQKSFSAAGKIVEKNTLDFHEHIPTFLSDPSDVLRIPENDTFTSLNTLTISAWIHKTGEVAGLKGTILELGQKFDKLSNVAPRQLVAAGNKIQFGAGFSTTDGMWETNANVFNDGEWVHVAVTYNGGATSNNPTIYINGASVTVNETQTPAGSIEQVLGESSIGKNHDTHYKKEAGAIPTQSPFMGYMDEVSLWDAVLTSAQITEIYNNGRVTNLNDHSLYSSNLKGWWRMGENANVKLSGFVHPKASNNYVIPDEIGSNDADMLGFADFSNASWDSPTNQPKFEKTGITKIHAPTTFTSSVGANIENNLVAGVVLYNEGFIILTGSWDLETNNTSDYLDNGTSAYPKWTYFGARLPSSEDRSRVQDLALDPNETPNNMNPETHSLDDVVYHMAFSGTNHVPTRTMLLHAPKGRLNHSNNSTHIQFNSTLYESTGSKGYFESPKVPIKNIVSSSHNEFSASFEKRTYISKIGIYDENKNLIAIAKTSSPIRKKETDDLTFKLKLDL